MVQELYFGYEGTTGNSGGVHLHMVIKVDDEVESPSKYMAPIFTPFFNIEKADEVLSDVNSKMGGDERLALTSDYFSLVRTVLLTKFNGTKIDSKYKNHESLGNANAVYLATASFELSGDANPLYSGEYVVYKETYTENEYGEEIPDEIKTLRKPGENKVIVKTGHEKPQYWLCELQEIPLVISENAIDDESMYYLGTNNQKVLLKVVNREEISASEAVTLNTVSVKTTRTSSESTNIVWGNNVPIYPLVEDSNDLINMDLLLTQKTFEAKKSEYEKDKSRSEYESTYGGYKDAEKDVRARSTFFDVRKTW